MSQISVYKEYRLGDMLLRYLKDEENRVGLMLLPVSCREMELPCKDVGMDPLVQVKLAGDVYQGGYAPGNTLRDSESAMALRLVKQTVVTEDAGQDEGQDNAQSNCQDKDPDNAQNDGRDRARKLVIETILEDARGCRAVHRVQWIEGDPFITCRTGFENCGGQPVMLELLSSFSLTGISPYAPGDCAGAIQVHRIQSRWSQEGRLLTQSLEDLQLETSWGKGAVRCERFGQAGSMPVNHYFPFLAVEDTNAGVFWGAQLKCPASWQMEVYRMDENIAVSGGLADREFGHWMKKLEPGESITGPEAILSVSAGISLDEFCQRLTRAGERAADAGPAPEQDLPVMFNEYCTTWGVPAHDTIRDILQAIRDKGFAYFVIDAGWYKKDGVTWDRSMGDYIPSRSLFPEGLDKTTAMIREAGMVPGLWFELENVGDLADAYHQTDHLLKRDGAVLTTTRRRFWDMQDPWVREYLRERVIGTLQTYGFGYMKIDYNDTIGIGCDGAESLGEGLRRNMAATMDFLKEVKQAVPGIVLENCASGGHRLEPGFMAETAMASFSDAHECPEIPIIAACLHRVILPRQSQIWAVIRREDSLKRIAYSIASTFLGRMCLSGDVTQLSAEQWDVIDRGIAFYHRIAPIIRNGTTRILSDPVPMVRHPQGWQGVLRTGENGEAFVLLHTFAGKIGDAPENTGTGRTTGECETAVIPETVSIRLPERYDGKEWHISGIYSDTEENIILKEGRLLWKPAGNWKAAAVLLTD